MGRDSGEKYPDVVKPLKVKVVLRLEVQHKMKTSISSDEDSPKL